MTNKVFAIVGATASGKTEISVKLAEMLGGEVVSADSRLVYRDFNIGTAKPALEELRGIPHHMIDIVDPKKEYSAGKYKQDAEKCIDDILSRGKVPIVVGGTGFYVKALLEGLDIPEIDPDEDLRRELYAMAESYGKEAVFRLLQESDPASAEKIHPHNLPRVIRAIEVEKVTGRPFSELQTKSEPKYNVFYAGLSTTDRDVLYDRINRRVLQMIDMGLVDEVKSLILKHGRTVSLMNTLGYKEICEYMEGRYTLEEAIGKIQQHTRNFAKRQLTWFRGNKQIHWFYIDKHSQDEICREICQFQ